MDGMNKFTVLAEVAWAFGEDLEGAGSATLVDGGRGDESVTEAPTIPCVGGSRRDDML